jgi:hypothetical protein
MQKPSFADFYSLEQYGALREHDKILPVDAAGKALFNGPDYTAWSAVYRQHCDIAENALGGFLKAIAAAGKLKQLPETYKRKHRLALAWNALAAGGVEGYQLDQLTRRFDYALLVMDKYAARQLPVEVAYADLIGRANAGTLEWFEADSREECGTTGEQVYFELSNWAPRLGTVDASTGERDLRPLRPIPRPSVIHQRIPVPSGELLIADWFRIPAFTEAVEDPAKKACEYSINNEAGCARYTAWCAKQGFMSVFVGDGSRSIIERDGHLLIADIDEDGELGEPPVEGRFAGSVCNDLWWTSAIDRQVLTDIIARSVPRVEAERLVEDMVQTQHSDVTTLKVPKGVLHVYHTADKAELQNFRSPDVPDSSVEQLYAVLSQRELSWAPKETAEVAAPSEPAAARRARP